MSRETRKVHTVMVDAGQAGNYLELILDLVLPYLPLRDICKTSILSRKWRHKWKTVPVLKFLGFSCRTPRANIINHVLSLHSGSIQALQIFVNLVPDIDSWILYVSRMSIKSLVLKIIDANLGGQRYALPSSFFNCESLVHLDLLHCLVDPPSSFKGFHNLKCLELFSVTMTQGGSDNMISSCPSLEKLRLHSIEGQVNLKIDSPSLQRAHIAGDIESLTFRCPLVKCLDIEIGMSQDIKVGRYSDMENRMIQLFVDLPAIRRLSLFDYLLKHLAVGVIPERIPSPFSADVSTLEMDIDFTDRGESLAALCLFKSSPALTQLYARSRGSDGVEYFRSDNDDDYYCSFDMGEPSIWADDLRCDWRFDKLETVEVVVIGHRAELEFIGYVLKSSPALDYMMVYCDHASGGLHTRFLGRCWSLAEPLLRLEFMPKLCAIERVFYPFVRMD